jgi:hypothetical protein
MEAEREVERAERRVAEAEAAVERAAAEAWAGALAGLRERARTLQSLARLLHSRARLEADAAHASHLEQYARAAELADALDALQAEVSIPLLDPHVQFSSSIRMSMLTRGRRNSWKSRCRRTRCRPRWAVPPPRPFAASCRPTASCRCAPLSFASRHDPRADWFWRRELKQAREALQAGLAERLRRREEALRERLERKERLREDAARAAQHVRLRLPSPLLPSFCLGGAAV